MKIVLVVIAAITAAAIGAAIAGSLSWRRATRSEIDHLAPAATPVAAFEPGAVDHLPLPVARYLRKAITNGHPLVRSAITTKEAEFFINGAWRSLHAMQHFSVSPPGFVWDARIEMAPLMPVFVRDQYIDTRAKMQASMYGVYSLADQIDKPQLNAGALQRFLGESIWFPTALLPSDGVVWSPRDDRSAVVVLSDGPNTVKLLFEFGEDALPGRISGDRYKEDNGQYAVHTWQIDCGNYAVRDGLTIPMHCEVAWVIGGTRQPYWRGRISSIEYHYDVME